MNRDIMRIRLLLTIACSIAALAAFMVFALYQGVIRFNYPSREEFPIQGIDISHHQKEIDWDRLNTAEIQFIFIKATEGGNFKDKRFHLNWKDARQRGFVVGAYHFFTFCSSGDEQADNFISSVPVEKGTLPPVIDLEYGGNCQLTSGRLEVLKEVEVLSDRLEKAYGQRPILYVTREFYDDFLIDKMPKSAIWLRDVYRKPGLQPDNRDWLFWQYANRGKLEGIETFVDFNVFNGKKDKFETLIND